ncbi:MAG TPA: proton-conducting transporter membrane subunit [Terriglobales bacterium]|nr:proton-conducting transporter membrane subunit [Terriglobales bacterium]
MISTVLAFVLVSLVAIPAVFLAFGKSPTTRRAACGLLIASLAAGAVAAWRALSLGEAICLDLSAFAPLPFALAVDHLSALFLFLICAVSVPAMLFSSAYLEGHYEGLRRQVLWALMPLFLGSMVVVVTASTAFAFLFGWELMTLFSAALILVEGTDGERGHSLFIYLLMMHAGAAAVAASFFLFAGRAPGLEFAGLRAAGAAMPAGLRNAIFLLALVGFGTKAGIIPLHLWLPRAHPIAPSPVSALMSGIMLKTAVYGLVRFGFYLLPPGPSWWGYALLGAGALSGTLGALYALGEHDLKRLLAYSSVENIGLIFLAAGAAMVLAANGAVDWAVVALVAALLHAFNHAIFKSALFLGAGAVADATHTVDLEQLGGLFRHMRLAAIAMLVACGAIAGLPLLNGFVGEWLMFRSLVAGAALSKASAAIVLPAAAGVLALIGGLAASCFANVFAVTFLGRPRSAAAEHAKPVPAAMSASLALLAGACVILGVAPGLLLRPLAEVAGELIGSAAVPDGAFSIASILPYVALAVAVAIAAIAVLRRRARVTSTWGCGLPGLDERMQYTSTAFSKPLRKVFANAYRAERTVEVAPAGESYFPQAISYRSVRTTSYERALYRPAVDAIVAAAHRLRRLQTGNIQVYLLYIFLALVALLMFVRFA